MKSDLKIFILCLRHGKKKIYFPKTKISFGFEFFQLGHYEIIYLYFVIFNIKIYTEFKD